MDYVEPEVDCTWRLSLKSILTQVASLINDKDTTVTHTKHATRWTEGQLNEPELCNVQGLISDLLYMYA